MDLQEPEEARLVVVEPTPTIGQERLSINQWKVCCGGSTDRRVLTFVASLSLSTIIMIFSCYQLTRGLDCSQENTYIGLITLIIGFWMKSPLSSERG